MSFSDLVSKVLNDVPLSRVLTLYRVIERFGEVLRTQQTIRLFVDNTGGMGLQASSIYVLNLIIAKFNYGSTVTIVYKPVDDKGKLTIDKLAIFIPRLDPKNIQDVPYRGCTLQFREFGKVEDASVPLSFTGGADNIGDRPTFLQGLNTDCFLCLQPYFWPGVEAVITAGGSLDLDDNDKYGETFNNRAYEIPDPIEPSRECWDWFISHGPRQKETLLAEQLLRSLSQHQNIQLWPLYGVRDENQMRREASEILAAISAVALKIQKDSQPPRPILIVNFDSVGQKSIELLKGLLNGGTTTFEKQYLREIQQIKERLNSKTSMDIDGDLEQLLAYENFCSGRGPRSNFLRELFAREKVTVIDSQISKGELAEEITKLSNSANVLVFQLGNVPPEIFQFLFSKAKIPPAFEGQGTAMLALNLGRPFIQMPLFNTNALERYPSENLVNFNFTGVSIKARNTGNAVIEAFMANVYGKGVFKEKITFISQFIFESTSPVTPLNQYFKSLRTFYQNPINDKFLLGIAALNYVITGQTVFPSLATKDGFDLEALYETLLSNLLDGTLNLIPASLPEGAIVDFYREFSSSGSVTIHQAKVEAKRDGTEIIEIEVTGTTDDFGLDLSAELKFTSALGHLSSSATFKAVDTWSIEGIPWIPFNTPGFSLEITDGSIPIHGSIFGTIQGPIPFVLSITLPSENSGWLLEAIFEKDSYPSIASFYGLAGGVDLTQILPSPLNTFSNFGLQEIEAIYNTERKQIDYLLFVFSTSEPWELFPLLTVTGVEIQAVVQSPSDLVNRTTMAVITASFVIGQGTIQISTTIPGFLVQGGLSEGEIQLGDLITFFLPGVELDLHSAITDFSFSAMPASSQYSVGCYITTDWDIKILGTTVFTIKSLSFEINHFQGFTSGSFSGLTLIDPDDSAIEIMLTAIYLGTGAGWQFEGSQTEMSNPISIGKLLEKYLHWQTDESYGINGLGIAIETQSSSYSITGKTAEPWEIPFPIGDNPSVSADFLVSYTAKEREESLHSPSASGVNAAGYSGELSLQIQYYFIDVSLFYNFDPAVKKYGLLWGKFRGLIEQNEKQEWVGSVQLNNFTLGSMVETFISWATGQTFGLSAPWNLLDSINLNSFYLTFNFTTDQVAIHYNIGPINLGFAQIEALTLAYNPKEPNGRVKITLTGSFFWQDNPQTPISWDPTDPGNTPGPPGGGNKYIDLRLLTLGQHVSIEGYSSFSTVEEAITAMKGLKEPAQGQIPIPPTNSIKEGSLS